MGSVGLLFSKALSRLPFWPSWSWTLTWICSFSHYHPRTAPGQWPKGEREAEEEAMASRMNHGQSRRSLSRAKMSRPWLGVEGGMKKDTLKCGNQEGGKLGQRGASEALC